MEIRKILADLIGERNRIVRAIDALLALDGTGVSVSGGRPAAAKVAPKKAGRRGLTPAGRRRLSAMMKARWAARRKAAAPAAKQPAAKPAPGQRRMSAAARKKIAVAQKARWAARKKAAKNAPVAKKTEAATAAAE